MNIVEIHSDECKGCCLCISGCPKNCLVLGSKINAFGYQYAKFDSQKCTACGICYYVCPEPGAITVHQEEKEGK